MANLGDWILPSGRAVEDVLALWVALLPGGAHPYAQLYIIDVDDREVESQFTAQEWAAIVAQLLPNPPLPVTLLSYISRFRDVNTPSRPHSTRR